jgi:hypothetical protein
MHVGYRYSEWAHVIHHKGMIEKSSWRAHAEVVAHELKRDNLFPQKMTHSM